MGESERLLPGTATVIRNARGDIERRLDGGVAPQPVAIWETTLPPETVRLDPMDGIATKQDREKRKRRLYSKRQIIGA